MSSPPPSEEGRAWLEADDEEEVSGDATIGDGLEDLADSWADGDRDLDPDGKEPPDHGGWGTRGTGVETTRRRSPRSPLPLDDVDIVFKRAESSGTVKTPFKEENSNKELKGCLMVLLLAAVVGGGWFLTNQLPGEEKGPSPVKHAPPPITHVEAIPEKAVVATPRAKVEALARKLVAPPEKSEEKKDAPPTRMSAATILGMPEAKGDKALDDMIRDQKAMEANSVCFNGQPARRGPSLYGLPGGFSITYGQPSTDGPRLEFMPPSVDQSKNILYYAAFGEPKVKEFEGDRARSVPNSPEAIQHIILTWMAGLANGPCDKGALSSAGP